MANRGQSQGYQNLHRRRLHILSVEGWTIEYASALLSVLSLAGLAIPLAVRNNRPIFDWHGLTINALVTLLSTVSRASLIFTLAEAISQTKWIFFNRTHRKLYDFEVVDVASRDAVGRLMMLWRMPSGKFPCTCSHLDLTDSVGSIATVGVIAALLGIAFDPFAQQLVQTTAVIHYADDVHEQLPIAKPFLRGRLFGQSIRYAYRE